MAGLIVWVDMSGRVASEPPFAGVQRCTVALAGR